MANGFNDNGAYPFVPIPNLGRGRAGVFMAPNLSLSQFCVPVELNGQRGVESLAEEAVKSVPRGRGRLQNRGHQTENFRVGESIQEQCRNYLGNSHCNVLLTSLVQPSKGWFSDGNSFVSGSKKHSQSAGMSRSDAEVYYSKYNSSDSYDDTLSSTVTSSSVSRIQSEHEEPIVAEQELAEKPKVAEGNEESIGKNDVLIAKIVEENIESVVEKVKNDNNCVRIVETDAKVHRNGDAAQRSVKSDVKFDKNDIEVKKNGGAIKKTVKNDSQSVNRSSGKVKPAVPSVKKALCSSDRVVSKEFDPKGDVSSLEKTIDAFDRRNKQEEVVDNWWDIDTTSEKSSSHHMSKEIPERDVPIVKQSSIAPLATVPFRKNSNQSVYGNWDTDVRSFDAFGKQKRNTFPRFSIERDFPALGANTATNFSIRPSSPVTRNIEQKTVATKKQQAKPIKREKNRPKVLHEEPVEDPKIPGTIVIQNLPSDICFASLSDFLEPFGRIEKIELLPPDGALVTYFDCKNCPWVAGLLDNSQVPFSDSPNILSVHVL